MKTSRFAALAFGALLASQAMAAAVRYDVKAVAGLPGAYFNPVAINASGQIVGTVGNATMQSFATGPQGEGLLDPCPAAVMICSAAGIDDAGDVALAIYPAGGDGATVLGAFAAADGSNLRYIGDLGGSMTSPQGLSHRGLMTGIATTAQGERHAFIARAPFGRRLRDLGVPAGDAESGGQAVNDRGQVAGYVRTSDTGDLHAMLALPDGSPIQDLGTLDDSVGSTAVARGISDNGYVVGYSSIGGGYHAVLGRVGERRMTDLGTLRGGFLSYAYGVNSSGRVVGSAIVENGASAGFVLDVHDKTMIDLNTVADMPAGVTIAYALAINEAGQIAAGGSDYRVYLLTPR